MLVKTFFGSANLQLYYVLTFDTWANIWIDLIGKFIFLGEIYDVLYLKYVIM